VPINLDKSDRRILLWAAAILLPILAALALSSANQEDSGVPSSYSAQSSGAKAAFLLLQQEGYNVEPWERSPSELPIDGGRTVLVLANPSDFPTPGEKRSLEQYLEGGGKVVITGSSASLFLPRAETTHEFSPDPTWKEYRPRILSALTRGGPVKMVPAGYWEHPSTAVLVHYAAEDGRPVMVSYRVGKGQVIWWASSTPLSNAGISTSGNLALLLNSLGGAGTHVYWDEYFHGIRRTLLSYAFEWPAFLGLVQGGLVVVALLVTYSRRNGPIYPRDESSRLSPLEFVETLGGLYRRAHHTRTALEVPYTRFRALATRRLGLKADLPSPDLARAIHNRFNVPNDVLQDLFRDIETAMYDPELTEAETLRLVQQLSRHARSLQLEPFCGHERGDSRVGARRRNAEPSRGI
jgi:hypothetical protein